MAYQSETIQTAIGRLNSHYFLPAVQREFVWTPTQVISLFDSLMRGYPIGSFLFWELEPANKGKWEAYRFIDHARTGGTINTLASTRGVKRPILVLDGQQRLTSFLIGLKGTYEIKRKWARRNDTHAWSRQRLFLDLLKEATGTDEEDEDSEYYAFRFSADQIEGYDSGHYWFQPGRILDFETEDSFDEFRLEERDRLPDEVTKGQLRVFERNLERLYRAVWKDDVIAYYTERQQDYDRALDIFIKANEEGTKLSRSDMLFSIVTSRWKRVPARQEIPEFVTRLNNSPSGPNSFGRDFVMRTCLVLSESPVKYKVGTFTNANLTRMEDRWPEIKLATERAVNLINSFGINYANLTSHNAVIPIAYYFLQRPGVHLRGTTPEDVRNRGLIQTWLISGLLNGAFGGSSDTLLAELRRTISQALRDSDDFPTTILAKQMARSGRQITFDKFARERLLATRYTHRNAFLAVSLLYEEKAWGTLGFHLDHIFPRDLFSVDNLNKNGIPPAKHAAYRSSMDRLANLELLVEDENREKSNQNFAQWLTTRDKSFRKRHLIPDDSNLLSFSKFEEFLTAREQLIMNRIDSLLVT